MEDAEIPVALSRGAQDLSAAARVMAKHSSRENAAEQI